MNECYAWKPVLRKIENKLSSWKAKLLSRAGKLTLINSMLNSLPIYYLSIFRMPKAVDMKIVKLQRRFFWGNSAIERFPTPMVKWSSIELPKKMGGLGVGNILHKYLILLFKWWWRFSESDNSLWKRILISIYNIKGLKASSESFGGIKSGTWVHLLKDDQDTKKIRHIVEEGLSVSVGDGKSTRFWHDKWCSPGPLKVLFPRLFSISTHRDAMISHMGSWEDDEWVWNFGWKRSLYDWENTELDRLTLLVAQVSPQPRKDDGVNWHGYSYHKFPIKDIVDRFYESFNPLLPKAVCNFIWKIKVPLRAQLILWLANLEKLKTGDALVNKGLIDPLSGHCPFCDAEVESNSHVLFTCTFSWSIWTHILEWWGVSGVLSNHCPTFTLSWTSLVPRRCRGKLWNLILGCMIWSLWFGRNKVKFKNRPIDAYCFLSTVKTRIAIWAKELLGLDAVSYNAFSLRPEAILY